MQNFFFEVKGIDHVLFVGRVCVCVCVCVCLLCTLVEFAYKQLHCKYLEDKNCVSNAHYIGIST